MAWKTDKMNDLLEGEFIQSNGKMLHFTSFSRVEENLAMYKMYSPAPDGIMIGISYTTAKKIIEAHRASVSNRPFLPPWSELS